MLVLLAAAGAAFAPLSPDRVEHWYSLSLYPLMQRVTTSATNTVPFALLDLLLLLATVAVAFVLVRGARATVRQRSALPFASAVFNVAWPAAAVYVVFLAVWGLNYRRVPMADRLVLAPVSSPADQVLALGLEAVRQLNARHSEAHRIGWGAPEWRSVPLTTSAAAVQTELTGVDPAVPGRLKRSILGPYFRWTGVDGMVNPFGLEVIGNPDLLPFERPFVAAHEWAHLAGFADESEANFVGFLTCVRASAPDQYSGWLYLFWQLAAETDGAARAQLWEAIAPGPRADVDAIVSRLRRGELPRLRVASWRVYDKYLKANRVESGVRSYGAVVNLLIRARFEPGWVPVRQAARLGTLRH